MHIFSPSESNDVILDAGFADAIVMQTDAVDASDATDIRFQGACEHGLLWQL